MGQQARHHSWALALVNRLNSHKAGPLKVPASLEPQVLPFESDNRLRATSPIF